MKYELEFKVDNVYLQTLIYVTNKTKPTIYKRSLDSAAKIEKYCKHKFKFMLLDLMRSHRKVIRKYKKSRTMFIYTLQINDQNIITHLAFN